MDINFCTIVSKATYSSREYLHKSILFDALIKLFPDNCRFLEFCFNSKENRYELDFLDIPKNSFIVFDGHVQHMFNNSNNIQWESTATINDINFMQSYTLLNTLKYLQECKVHVIVETCAEGALVPPKLLRNYISRGKEINYSLQNIIFVSNNSQHIDIQTLKYGENPINVLHFPFWLVHSFLYAKYYDNFTLEDTDKVEITKQFLIPIRKARMFRIVLLSILDKMDLLSNSDWSCSLLKAVDVKLPTNVNSKYLKFKDFFIKYNLLNRPRIIEGTEPLPEEKLKDENSVDLLFESKTFASRFNMKAFSSPENNFMRLAEIYIFNKIENFKNWSRAKVTIIPETHVVYKYTSKKDNLFPVVKTTHITEKTFKCIRLGKPFVIFGQKDSLKHLKKYGFLTFNQSIDESYDELDYYGITPTLNLREDTPAVYTHAKKVIDAGTKLAEIYDTDKVKEICKHNFLLIRNENYIKQLVKTIFFDNLLNISSESA